MIEVGSKVYLQGYDEPYGEVLSTSGQMEVDGPIEKWVAVVWIRTTGGRYVTEQLSRLDVR